MEQGAQFGPYRVLGVLGRGGMGEVLRAHDAEHERDVALKVLHPQWASDESYRERFRREARVAARLREPHVVPIHRYGEIDGRLFLDMRLVEGEDLASLLRRTGPLEPARAVDVVGQVARALDAAHADGLVHRDVKPSNILLVARPDGRDLAGSAPGDDFVYLVDFGIARTVDSSTGPSLTATGLTVGSTEYMAPERFLGSQLGAGADVYSLACVLFEALTGERPFPAADAASQMYAHVNTPPPLVSSLRPGVPDLLDGIVARGLAKDPGERWTSAGGMAAAARAALSVSGVEVPRPAEAPPGGPIEGTAPTTIGLTGGPGDRPDTRVRPLPGATAVGPPPGGQSAPQPPAGPPPFPGAPPWAGGGGPGAAPRPARRTPWAWVAVAVVALLAAVALAVLLVVTDRRADEARSAADRAQLQLLEVGLPADVDAGDCPATGGTDGALLALDCGSSDTEDGPTSQTYQLLASPAAAAAEFEADVARRELPQLDGDDDFACSSSDGDQGWVRLLDYDDQPIGRLSCSVEEDRDTVVSWTWDDRPGFSTVSLRGGDTDGVTRLMSWYRDNADRAEL
ncbi:serine/threonine-protein kinase [Modestobacter sp. Leaf380]|uniref:serine/threonine-protein kinase n=1 Tax=Modestobacter sp. Leaf380 TaxID=1736356 RepID=UPI0006FEFD44|nr:serine/threonine-protein kinase [Modestobacter sp. Leaf380]KQS73362.1 hypothetical protein ASG41_01445 [Modestobacter sp. Leaf380]